MRCKKCGGIMKWLVTLQGGERLYRCTTGLTHLNKDGSRGSIMVACGNVQDNEHRIIKQGTHVAYVSDNKLQVMTV